MEDGDTAATGTDNPPPLPNANPPPYQPVEIGVKVEHFYVAYREVQTRPDQLPALLEALFYLETHVPLPTETFDVCTEIVADCQKKAAQCVRAPYAEHVRTIIAALRKKLASKVALDSDAASQAHGQRHLNYLLELLGSWSNIVAEVAGWQLSRTVLRTTLATLHARVIEMAFECFEAFKTDKQLDSWHARVLATFNNGNAATFNLTALDFLLSQLAAMRDIVQQYYKFMLRTLRAAYDYGEDVRDAAVAAANATGAPDIGGAAGADGAFTHASQMDLLCTPAERNRWRELDAVYISLEHGYLARAVGEALGEATLLEMETYGYADHPHQGSGKDGPPDVARPRGALAPQAAEDVFFVLQRVAERALATGSESSAFGVGTRVAETLDMDPDDDGATAMAPGDTNGGAGGKATLYGLLRRRRTFRGCVRRGAVHVIKTGDNPPTSLPPPPPPPSQQPLPPRPGAPGGNAISAPPAPPASASGATASTGLAGTFSTWLKNLEEITAPLPEGSAPTSGARGNSNSSSNGGGATDGMSRGGTLDDLLSALEQDALGIGVGGDGMDDIDEAAPLAPVDAGVHLTTLALAPAAVAALAGTFHRAEADFEELELAINSTPQHPGTAAKAGPGAGRNRRTLGLVCQELHRCGGLYTRALQREAQAFAWAACHHDPHPHLHGTAAAATGGGGGGGGGSVAAAVAATCARPYTIDGAAMERRQEDCPVLMAVRALLGPALALTDTGRHASLTGATAGAAVAAGGAADTAPSSWMDVLAPVAATTAGGDFAEVLARGMSTPARNEVLAQLAKIVATAWLDAVAPPPPPVAGGDRGASGSSGDAPGGRAGAGAGAGGGGGGGLVFSEWGALLLQGEVAAVARVFDAAVDVAADAAPAPATTTSTSAATGAAPSASASARASASASGASPRVRVKAAFAALVWTTKLLALDQPADIRRYAVPATGLDPPLTEERVRALLARRVDFSRDAVQRVKINFVP